MKPSSLELFTLDGPGLSVHRQNTKVEWEASGPFKHAVVDGFLRADCADELSGLFPPPGHPVWLDWKVRSPAQYGKQGVGDTARFDLLDPYLQAALQQFNSWKFLQYLQDITSIEALLPDPYFTGGGMHQILQGGILDIHTDFNYYDRLKLYRRINVLLYLTLDWRSEYGGCLELWNDAPPRGGRCVREIAPLFNRMVVFETDKSSFHGHPKEWSAPLGIYRRSIALYYYTATPAPGKSYDQITDFQNYVSKELPLS